MLLNVGSVERQNTNNINNIKRDSLKFAKSYLPCAAWLYRSHIFAVDLLLGMYLYVLLKQTCQKGHKNVSKTTTGDINLVFYDLKLGA